MKGLLNLEKCPISELLITTKPEWKYIAKDGSCTYEIALIGDNILYEIPIGRINDEAIEWYTKTTNKIITEYFKDEKCYFIYDYSLLNKTSLKAKKLFVNWFLSRVDKIELVAIFGMNKIMKVAIKTFRFLYEKSNKLQLSNSYPEAINAILQKQNKSTDSKVLIKSNNDFLNNKQTENTRINELIAYLGKMTFTGDFEQKIPVLPDNDPLAGLFAAVATNQENLSEEDKKKEKINAELEKLIVEKDKAIDELSAKETLVQNSKEYYRTLIENSIDAITIIDINGDFVSISKSVEKISGYRNEELKRKKSFALLLPNDREKMMRVLEEIKENYGSIRNIAFQIYHKNGSVRDIEGTAKNMLHSPAVKGIVLNYRDVTQRIKQQNLLKQSEDYHRTLIENSIDAISVIDINGNFTSLSNSSENITGYTNEERENKSSFALMLPDDREKMMQVLKEIKEDYGSIRNIAFQIFHKDGSIRDIEGTAKNMLHSPAVKGIVLNYRDVTQKVKQQNLLKQSEDYHRTLIENSIDAISVIDINGNFISISKSAEKISGYSNKERKRKKIFALMLPNDREKMMRLLEEIKENYDSVTFTKFRIYHKDGTIRNIEGTVKNMLHSPVVKGIVLNYRDVTEQVKQQNLLNQSEEYHRTLIENSNDAIAVIDINGNYISLSNSSKNITGYTNEERKRKNPFALMLPEDREKIMRVFKEMKNNYGLTINTAFQIYHKDGSIRSIEGIAKNMLHSPAVKGIVHNYIDVTERKINELKIKRREAYLNALNKISELSFKTGYAKELQNFVEIIGKAANASRTYIFKKYKNQNNKPLLNHVAEYVATGIKPKIYNPDLQNMAYDDWPSLENRLKNGEIINSLVSEISDKKRYIFESQGIISIIVIPVFIENSFWGVVGFDNCVFNKKWNDNDIKYLKIATKRLENSIELIEKQKILEAENKRFKITMDAMNNGIYVADMQNYELLFLNKYFIDLIGDKTGKKCYNVFHGLDKPCLFCTNKHLLDTNNKPKQVYIWEHQNKITKRWFQHRDQAFHWVDGRMVKLQVAVDITEQKKANKKITKLSAAVEQSANAIVITDTKGNIEYTNPQYTKTTGYTAEEVLGKNPQFINAGTLPDNFHAKIWETLEKGEAWSGEFHNKSKTGKLYWENATITPIKENGEIINFISVQQDITKQKESAKQIRKLSQVVKTTSQSVVITNIDGNVVFVNEALVKLGGFDSESEIIGRSMYEYSDMQGVAKLKEEVLPSIFNKGYYFGEFNFKTEDNNILPVEINSSFIKDEAGNPELIVAMFSDITERKQAEEDLISAKEKAEESNRLKTAFLNNMSHEIRTPLNGITGFASLLQNPDLDAKDKRMYIDVINKSSNRLIATVTDIIEISKIETGLVEVFATKVSVNEIFNELYELFSIEAENKGLKLKQLPSLSNDKAIVQTDNHKLTGILINLIKNAIKFTDKGSVTFGYSIIKDTEKGSLMQFYVKDTGIGVPKNRQQAIFNSFEQADIEDTRAFEGSGLGLSIAKSYVEVLGGKIWLSSEENVGTEFVFTIPY